MGVSHSMNKSQVDEVLTEFESTTDAIKGIEVKISRVQGYVKTAKEQRETMSRQAEEVTSLMDNMTATMNNSTEDLIDYFTETLDFFADLMESLETTIADLQLMNAPRELQRELGPLLVPAIVLVLIITASNCVFGFLLASDEEAAGRITLDMLLGGTGDKDEIAGSGLNILRLFAVVHVVLIGIAVLYLILEGCRRQYMSRRRRPAHHKVHRPLEADAEESDEEYVVEEEMLDEERQEMSSDSRVNKQLNEAVGDSDPLADTGDDSIFPPEHSRSMEYDLRYEVGSPETHTGSPSRGSSPQEDPRAEKVTPPRPLQPLRLPEEEYDYIIPDEQSTTPKEIYWSDDASQHSPSRSENSPRHQVSPSNAATSTRQTYAFRSASGLSNESTPKTVQIRELDTVSVATNKTSKARRMPMGKMRTSLVSEGSGRGSSPQRGRLSMAVPRMPISSVLRKVQQKAVQVTKEGAIIRPNRDATPSSGDDQEDTRSRSSPRTPSPTSAGSTNVLPASGVSPLRTRLGKIGEKSEKDDQSSSEMQSTSTKDHAGKVAVRI